LHRIIDSVSDPAAQLATDEALLLAACPALRVWEFTRPIVIAGRATRIDDEINQAACDGDGTPVLRRCTGGAAVVGGPGCLMYSVVLSCDAEPSLRGVDAAHDHVINRVCTALRQQIPAAQRQGICDLTWHNRKCSGNSLRITRQGLLYHGTILYDFDLTLIARYLKVAPRQPAYRDGREHAEFVTNVPIDPQRFATDLETEFAVSGARSAASLSASVQRLRRQRYDDPAWHRRH
jgi:lipoate-protein ligase A